MAARFWTIVYMGISLAVITAAAQTGAVRADFKGARLGMSMQEWRAVNDGYFKENYRCVTPNDKADGDTRCDWRTSDPWLRPADKLRKDETLAGVRARCSFRFLGNNLEHILCIVYDPREPDTTVRVKNALTARLGSPTSSGKSTQTFGEKTKGDYETSVWNLGSDEVLLMGPTDQDKEVDVVYRSLRGEEEFTRRETERDKKDL